MDRFTEMEVFICAAETMSFSAAARALAMTPSAVSKIILRLERRLGVLMFKRTPRTITMTQEGKVFLDHAIETIDALRRAEGSVRTHETVLQGVLSIYCLPTFAVHCLAPLLPEFTQLYPDIKLRIRLGNEIISLAENGIDVALLSGRMPDTSLIRRTLVRFRWVTCASPEYLASRGTPTEVHDLRSHVCLNFLPCNYWNRWQAPDRTGSSMSDSPVASNSPEFLKALAMHGAGIIRVAEFLVRDDIASGRLVPVLEGRMEEEIVPFFALYPRPLNQVSRTSVFVDFLSQKLSHRLPKTGRINIPQLRAG